MAALFRGFMSGKTIITNLQLCIQDKNWGRYDNFTAAEKIIWIKKRILAVCEQLKKIHPNEKWLICIREYSVFNSPTDRFVWEDMKNQIIREMIEITSTQPNLAIYLPLSVRRRGSNVARTKREYRANTWIDFHEYQKNLVEREPNESKLTTGSSVKEDFEYNKNLVCRLYSHKKSLQEIEKKLSQPNFYDEITNSIYMIEARHYKRYDKQAPFYEIVPYISETQRTLPEKPLFIAQNPSNLNNYIAFPKSYYPLVYSPGRSKHKYPIVTHKHPSGDTVTVGQEICRDHQYATLRKLSKLKELDIHLVVSATIRTFPSSIAAKHFIHVDCYNPTQFIISSDDLQSDVILYETNLLKNKPEMLEILPFFHFITKQTTHPADEKYCTSDQSSSVTEVMDRFEQINTDEEKDENSAITQAEAEDNFHIPAGLALKSNVAYLLTMKFRLEQLKSTSKETQGALHNYQDLSNQPISNFFPSVVNDAKNDNLRTGIMARRKTI